MALNDQQRKFVENVVNSGMVCRSAASAGYSKYSGFSLMRNPEVANAIAEFNVDRKQHQHQTYRNLCDIAEEAVNLMFETLGSANATLEEKQLAMEGAGRQVERVARAEGLLLPLGTGVPKDGEGHRVSMQTIIQIVSQSFGGQASPQRILDATAKELPPKPANGNGTNGQNH
jgi:phage terminase small subunit